MIDLKVVVTKYPGCLENSEKFRNYMKDLYPERADQVRIKVLADAINCGIVDEIRSGKTGPVDVTRYRTLMEQQYGYSSRLVFECVTKWISAFQLEKSPQGMEITDRHTGASNAGSNISREFMAKKQAGQIHTHVFSDTVVAPTCIEHGYTLHRCKCGYERKDQFTPFGDHIFELVDSVAPTCTESGRKDYLCAVCSEYKSETLPSRDHQWGKWVDQIYATCTEDGIKVCQCSVCGEIKTYTVTATGHNYSEWGLSRSDPGKTERFCKKCGKIDILDYNFDEFQNDFEIEKGEIKKYKGNKTCIIIPDGITSIGENAFYEKKIKQITIPPSVTSIGRCSFYRCSSLQNVILSNGITDIGDFAFSVCSNLERITIPNSVKNIGGNAFSCCYNLTSVSMSTGITSIGMEAFENCKCLKSITLPESITFLGAGAFKNCGLRKIEIPKNVTNIENSTFKKCRLNSIKIPESVKSIGAWAFDSCWSLSQVTIPNSVMCIGRDAFRDCRRLENIHFKGSPEEWRELTEGRDDLKDTMIQFSDE